MITCREGVDKNSVVRALENSGVQTRMLFSGNITRQPCFHEMAQRQEGYRIAGELTVTDEIMEKTFWVGVYPGMTERMLDVMAEGILRAL